MNLTRIDHIQLAMPAGGEDAARSFYDGLLGIPEVPKPAILAKRGGVWFELGSLKVHLGIAENFIPALKAHPAFESSDLPALRQKLNDAGQEFTDDDSLEGYDRFYINDPFGNRIEILQPL